MSYHFPGKQVLLCEAALDLVERSFPLEQVRAAGSLAEVVGQMQAWAGGPAPIDQLGREVLLEAMREAGRDPTVRIRLAGLLAQYRQVLADLVRAASHRGEAPAGADPVGLAALLAAAGDGLLLHAMLDPETDLVGAVEALGALIGPTGPTGGEPKPGRVTARGGRR